MQKDYEADIKKAFSDSTLTVSWIYNNKQKEKQYKIADLIEFNKK